MQMKALHHRLCVTFRAVISVFDWKRVGNTVFGRDIYCKPPAILCSRRLVLRVLFIWQSGNSSIPERNPSKTNKTQMDVKSIPIVP